MITYKTQTRLKIHICCVNSKQQISDFKITPWDICSCWIDLNKNATQASAWPQDLACFAQFVLGAAVKSAKNRNFSII